MGRILKYCSSRELLCLTYTCTRSADCLQEKKLKEIILVGSSHAHERTDSQLTGDPQLSRIQIFWHK
jgi:hypothetical protein